MAMSTTTMWDCTAASSTPTPMRMTARVSRRKRASAGEAARAEMMPIDTPASTAKSTDGKPEVRKWSGPVCAAIIPMIARARARSRPWIRVIRQD